MLNLALHGLLKLECGVWSVEGSGRCVSLGSDQLFKTLPHSFEQLVHIAEVFNPARSGSGIREASRAALVAFAIYGSTVRMNISDCVAGFKHYFRPRASLRGRALAAGFRGDSRRDAGAAELIAIGNA